MQQNWQNEGEKKADAQNEKNSWYKLIDTKIVALFILGILIGVTLKTHALKTVTMGFEDYKLAQTKQDFDLSGNNTKDKNPDENGGQALDK